MIAKEPNAAGELHREARIVGFEPHFGIIRLEELRLLGKLLSFGKQSDGRVKPIQNTPMGLCAELGEGSGL